MKHGFRKFLNMVFIFGAAFLLVSCGVKTVNEETPVESASESADAPKESHIVILATSDMHSNVWGYSYVDGAETANNGMARLYTYIEEVRRENDAVFLIDGGDEIQGTIMTDEIANKNPDDPHPVMEAMNFMEYDAMTLGNHEFNWGVDTMKRILSQAKFPVLCENILNKDGSCVSGKGWTIIERGGVKLAVIGVCTPDVPIWDVDKQGVADLTFEPADVAVQRAIQEIGDKADIILVSAHMGQYAEYDEEGGSDCGEKILTTNPEVDILQLAHMHITVNEKIGDVPAVAVRNSAREVARIDVTLDKDRNIKDISTDIIEMADYEPSSEIRDLPVVRALHEKTIEYVQGGSGEDGDRGAVIGTAEIGFWPEDEIKGIPEGRLKDNAVMDLILGIQLEASGADVTAASFYSDVNDLPEGDIHYRDILDIYKYDNTLCTLDVTGKELKAYMEWAVSGFNQWNPGDINISFDPEYTVDMMDEFEGVDYEVNLSKPKGQRIENVYFKGEPLKDEEVLKLAVNNYRYSSVIKPMKLAEGNRDWESSGYIRDMIVEYLGENSPVEPVLSNNWRITGADLSITDPRRDEIIGYINEDLLPTPYEKSYNLSDYDSLVREALAN